MRTLSVTQAARNFQSVIESVEKNQEEIVLVRNRKPIARLVPDVAPQNALEVFSDLYRTQDEEIAKELSSAITVMRNSRSARR